MMMVFGMMVFMRQTLPYQEMQRSVNYRWPSNSRVGMRASAQFIGVGDEKITLSGELRPEITGGTVSLLVLKIMADEGRAWPLIGGNGTIYGMYVVEDFTETHRDFFSDGTARNIGFTLNMKRVDESLTSMFGDLKKQAEGLIGGAGNLQNQLSTAASSALSGLGGIPG